MRGAPSGALQVRERVGGPQRKSLDHATLHSDNFALWRSCVLHRVGGPYIALSLYWSPCEPQKRTYQSSNFIRIQGHS
jgi:hypothetical protein